MVNEVKLALAKGFDGITPDTYIIEADTEMIVDDVSFECPAGELPCVVIVTALRDADGVLTGRVNVLSLGGAATVGNSMAVVNTIAAIALHSPDPAAGGADDITILMERKRCNYSSTDGYCKQRNRQWQWN